MGSQTCIDFSQIIKAHPKFVHLSFVTSLELVMNTSSSLDNTTGKATSIDHLSKLEQNFHHMLMQAPAAIAIVHGPEHIYTLANPLYQKIFGRKDQELIGRSIREVWPEIDGQGIYQIFHQVFTSAEPFVAHEYPVTFMEEGISKNGYYDFVAKPIQDVNGKVADIMIHAVDVSEQVLARKKVEDSESYFRKMADTTPAALWMTEKDGSCCYLNKQWYEITGQIPEDTRAFGWLKAIHPHDSDQAKKNFFEANEEQTSFSSLYRLRHKDGGYRWVTDNGRPRYDERGVFAGFIGVITDVHEQKDASHKLFQSEARYRNIFEGTPVSIWVEDFSKVKDEIRRLKKEGVHDLKAYFANHKEHLLQLLNSVTVKDVNEASLLLMEAPTKEELKKGLAQIFVEDTTDAFIGELEIIASGGGFFEYETKLQTLRGKPLDTLVHISFPRTEDYSSVIVTLIDITESKKIQQKISESEERYATTVYSSDLGLWDFDAIANTTVSSGRMAEILGFTSNGEITMQDLLDCIHPEDKEAELRLFEAILSGRIAPSFTTEYRIIQKNTGASKWVRARGKVFLDERGKTYRTVGTISDITERKQAEEAIRESESRFRTLAESLPQMVWMVDREGNYEYISGQWKAYCGKENPAEAWEYMIHPEDKQRSSTEWLSCLRDGADYRSEVRLRNEHGEYRWHYAIAVPLTDSNNQLTKWIGALTDIHVQKTFTEKLEKVVEERTKELQRSNEDLQQFAHVASHDLKEPARKIKTFSSLIMHEFGSIIPEKMKLYLSKIDSAAARMAHMIDGVLRYSSLDVIQQTNEKVDLSELIRNIETDLEVPIVQKAALIDQQNLPVIEGSSILLYQLFYNLINNSLKFARLNVSPLIRITATDTMDIDLEKVNLKTDQPYIKIIVQDNGIGFRQNEAAIIFQSFSRLHAKDKYEGTGLGLALCRKIVERHGGVIFADATEGVGASFTILLPKSPVVIPSVTF